MCKKAHTTITEVKSITDFERICCFENLYKAYRKSRRGKREKYSVLKFEENCTEELLKIQKELVSKTYQMQPYSEFKVYEPKERLVKSNGFRDKIIQSSLCDNYLNNKIGKHLILDNYASQKGKGTHFGLNRLSKFMRAHYVNHGSQGWILKGDISKYFYSIDHDVLKKQLFRYVDDKDIKWLLELIIDSTKGIGIPIGNQTSQYFAILYLNGIDHMIKDKMGIQYYGRYMDDFYIIHHDKEKLKEIQKEINVEVKKLGLNLNGKTQIFPLKNGIDFLGFHSYLTDTGKVIRKIRKKSKENAKRKIRKMSKLCLEGKLPFKVVEQSYQSWKGHAIHGNTYKLIQKTDACFNNLTKEMRKKHDNS